MIKETERQYLARREEEELLLSLSSMQPGVAEIHHSLATEYRTRLEELNKSDREPK